MGVFRKKRGTTRNAEQKHSTGRLQVLLLGGGVMTPKCQITRHVSAPCTSCGVYADPIHIDGETFVCQAHCGPCNQPNRREVRRTNHAD